MGKIVLEIEHARSLRSVLGHIDLVVSKAHMSNYFQSRVDQAISALTVWLKWNSRCRKSSGSDDTFTDF